MRKSSIKRRFKKEVSKRLNPIYCVCFFCLLFSFQTLLAEQNPITLGISHVAVKGKDVNKSVAFYHHFLGFDEEFRLKTKSDSTVLLLVAMKINDTQWLEIFDNSTNIGGNPLFQLSLRYQDDEVLRNYLKNKGYTVPNALTMGQMKNLNFMHTDPNGYAIE